MKKKISLKEALTGCNFAIKHLDDTIINICSESGDIINPNDPKVIKGKGMPFYKDLMNFGDLIIQFEIEWPAPKSMTLENIELIKTALPGNLALPVKKDREYNILKDWDKH